MRRPPAVDGKTRSVQGGRVLTCERAAHLYKGGKVVRHCAAMIVRWCLQREIWRPDKLPIKARQIKTMNKLVPSMFLAGSFGALLLCSPAVSAQEPRFYMRTDAGGALTQDTSL